MTVRYYVIPTVSIPGAVGPKYFSWKGHTGDIPEGTAWSFRSYGEQPVGIIAADVDPAQHAFLSAQADVYAGIPEDLDLSPTPQELSQFQAALEGYLIPADWLNQNDSWRVSLRTVVGMILYVRRVVGEAGNPFDWGYQLNTRLDQMTAEHQQALRTAMITLGYDDSVLRDNWTVRVLFKNAADQWGTRPIYLGNDSNGNQVVL